MNRSRSIKIFCSILLATAIFSACSWWQTAETEQSNSNSFVADELKSEIPFTTKEPEIFQADFVITTFANGEKTERITSVARNREKIRYDFPTKISFLQINENERYLIDYGKKIYAKSQTDLDEKEKTEETLKDFLTTKWLNEKHDAKFENLGAENGLTKYRVIADNNENGKSETIILFDEKLKIPVKQEFSLINGEQKSLIYSMEIRDFKFEANEKRFSLPDNYRQVSSKEFHESIWKKKFSNK